MSRPLKWSVPVDDKDHPIGSGPVLLVACQLSSAGNSVEVWTEEPDDKGLIQYRRARVYGTGQYVPGTEEHLGSAIAANGFLVWHLYGKKGMDDAQE